MWKEAASYNYAGYYWYTIRDTSHVLHGILIMNTAMQRERYALPCCSRVYCLPGTIYLHMLHGVFYPQRLVFHSATKKRNTRVFRRGGMTPACGSGHAGNGRGCRKIESISATVLPRGVRRNFYGWVRLGREITKRPSTDTLRFKF